MPIKDTASQGYPFINAISLDSEPTATNSDEFSNIDDTFYLEVSSQQTQATFMVDLYLGCLTTSDAGSLVYIQLLVQSGNSSCVAGAAQHRHASNLELPMLVRGFFQVSSNASCTVTPQWRSQKSSNGGGDAQILTPATDATSLISNFLTVTEISPSSGLVQSPGANVLGTVPITR